MLSLHPIEDISFLLNILVATVVIYSLSIIKSIPYLTVRVMISNYGLIVCKVAFDLFVM